MEAERQRQDAERKFEEAASKAAIETARNEKLVQRLANLRASLQEAATAARFEREILALKKQHVVVSESDSSDEEDGAPAGLRVSPDSGLRASRVATPLRSPMMEDDESSSDY